MYSIHMTRVSLYIVIKTSYLVLNLLYKHFFFLFLTLTGVGEFVGYFAGANILMEYVLSNAGVARSFTQYTSVAFGQNKSNTWRLKVDGLDKGYNMLDLPAVAIVLFLTLCLCHRFISLSLVKLLYVENGITLQFNSQKKKKLS